MPTETQTKTGHCPTHGTVEATRDMPTPSFPFLFYAIRRISGARRPFRCPTCGEAVTTS